MDADLNSFNKQLEEFVELTKKAVTAALRDLVVEVGACVIKFSPVLTGRFKGNWQMTVGTASSHSLDRMDPGGAETLSDLKIMAATLNPGEVAYIVNNLSYAYNVEVLGWAVTPAYQPIQRTLAEFKQLADEAIVRNKVK